MGLIANYSCLSDVNLKELKAMGSEEEEILESVEEWNDDDELLLDIDKMWDVLHFVLTGVGTDHKDDNNPLSQAVLGITAVEELSDYLAYTEHDKLADIVAALEQFDMEEALESFDMKACKAAELYPNTWDYDEEEEEIKDELLHDFEQMKRFYKQVLEANGHVLVSIC
ncbi:MAG: YfbM family protein [Veillonella sp.]|nr:YfbM family protein [Veillonella sp.]